DQPKTVRRLTLPGSWMWLAYNLVNVSWAGAITECFNTVSIFIAMWRFDRKGRKNS
ncbi:MAG: YgjV family protein, partial [Clostridia bacterium]|nr:YgjV family protein [Clostridia bacterium]